MAVALGACFGEAAGACAQSFMAACRQDVVPQLMTFFTDLLKRHESNTGLISPGVQPIPEQISVMIPARDLTIHDPKNKHWEWIDPKHTSFKEAAVLTHGIHSWEIKASIKFDLLLAMKTYVVYLIFKTTPDPAGLDAVLTATVSTEIGDELKDVCLSLKPKADGDQKSGDIQLPVKSSYEEWMELELGEFLCSSIIAKRVAEISIKVKESGKHNMRGVYVAGIELRSKTF